MATQRRLLSAAAAAALLAVGSAANANSIGVNFTGGSATGSLAPGVSAGVVPQTNWVNSATATGTALPLTDNTGGATGATVTYPQTGTTTGSGNQPNAAASATVPAGGDETLMRAGVGQSSYAFSVTGIPYAQYDLYVYIGNDNNAGGSVVGSAVANSVGGAPGTSAFGNTGNPNAAGRVDGNAGTAFNFVQAVGTTTGTATANANYWKFSGLTSSSLTSFEALNGTYSSTNFGQGVDVLGFQIVDAPEPASIGLLGLGGLGLLARRRRAESKSNDG